MEYKIELKENKDYKTEINNILTPSIKTGFNSYYIDKLKHLKTAIESFKTNKLSKSAKPYKIISPLSVSEDSELNKHYNFGIKQDFYIIYEIIKTYKLKGKIYSIGNEKIKVIIDKINDKNISYTKEIKNCDIIFNNSKINFLTNFYNQEVQQLANIKKTIKEIDNLNVGGDCIIRIYNIFLNDTINEIIKLTGMFEDVYIYKPDTVDNYKVDKYLVCLNKKKKETNTKDKTIKDLSFINTSLINNQTKAINQVINYINNRNYRGVEYQEYKQNQETAQKEFIKKMK